MSYNGHVVIITGSGQGLGEGFAEILLKEGAKVTISDLENSKGEETSKRFAKHYGKDRVHWCPCDVTKEDEFTNLFDSTEKFFGGTVDILVNNAGINHLPGWRKCMDVDIMAVMFGTYLGIERMGRSNGRGKGGQIINVASMAGVMPSLDEHSLPYFVAKNGVVTITKSLGNDTFLKKEGLKVKALCPSFTDTAIVTADKDMYQMVKEKFGADTIMTVDFVVKGFLTLLNDNRTGTCLSVMHEVPYIVWPTDQDYTLLGWLVTGAKLLKMIKPDAQVFGKYHQIAWMVISLFLLYLVFCILWAIVF